MKQQSMPVTSVFEIDFSSPEFLTNPYPYYDFMRYTTPIHYREDWQAWFLTAYDDINTLLRDKRLGRAILHVMTREELGWPPEPPEHAPFYEYHYNSLMEMEPPDHTRLKSLVAKAFSPRRVEQLRPGIQIIADELVEQVQARGSMNLLEDFAVPLSVTVIAELLGVPEEGRPRLRPWSADIVAMYELGGRTEEVVGRAIRAVVEFSAYLNGLIEQRRKQPQNDLLSALVSVEEAGDRLSEGELIATGILILNAGHEATVNAVGNGMAALLQHPQQVDLLKTNPALLPTAIEEMLRYDTPLPLFKRWALEDVEYKGHIFQKGQELAFLLGAANRDPQRFQNPHTFDITRQENLHLTFGAGIHYCLGAPLARLELQVAIDTLLKRLPNLRLDNVAELEYHNTFVFRGFKAVPALF